MDRRTPTPGSDDDRGLTRVDSEASCRSHCPLRDPTAPPCSREIALREANTALKRVLEQIEIERAEIYNSIQANVETALLPALRSLAAAVPQRERAIVEVLQQQLREVLSPFVSRVSKSFSSLTPAEIEICNLIRSGLSTKEIAHLRHVSPATVSKQRERIRQKLDIAKTDANLTTHLKMLSSQHEIPSVPVG